MCAWGYALFLRHFYNISSIFDRKWAVVPPCSVNMFTSQHTYSALMDIPGLEDTQMVDGSETTLRSMLVDVLALTISDNFQFILRPKWHPELTTWFYLLRTNKITYRCFTYRVCMEPAEVVFVVDWQSLQEFSLRTEQENINENTSRYERKVPGDKANYPYHNWAAENHSFIPYI